MVRRLQATGSVPAEPAPVTRIREVGTFTEYATKGGQLISSTWFEKLLMNHQAPN